MKFSRYLAPLVIIMFFTLSLLNIDALAIETFTPIIKSNNTNFDGYIIEFIDEPMFKFKNSLTNRIRDVFLNFMGTSIDSIINENIVNQRNKILSTHEKFKEEISKLLGDNGLSGKIISREFIDILNGIVVKNIPYEIINKIGDLPYVKEIIPNYKIRITLDEPVPLINANDVWRLVDDHGNNITGKNVTIAILDTGVDYTHSDLKDNYIADGSYDFVNNDADPMDDNGHGTHCAGIAVGKGNASNFQYVGVAPDAKFYALKIMDSNGSGDYDRYLAGMRRAMDPNGDGDTSDHADIISLSFGTEEPGNPDDNFSKIVDEAVDTGIVVVAAAGNLGPQSNTITSPGCARKSICVGATDKFDAIADFSSRGPVEWNGNYIVKPDLVAPGVSITSTNLGGGYTIKSGTSMATPYIAGAAALILQANPEFSPKEVKNALKNATVDLKYDCNTQGSGRINILKAFMSIDTLIIKSPAIVYEKQCFKVDITNVDGKPSSAWVLFTIPFHLPRLKYGSSVRLIAPIIFRGKTEELEGKIIVFKRFGDSFTIKKSITILNS